MVYLAALLGSPVADAAKPDFAVILAHRILSRAMAFCTNILISDRPLLFPTRVLDVTLVPHRDASLSHVPSRLTLQFPIIW